MWVRLLLIGLAVLLPGFAPAPFHRPHWPDDTRADRKRMQGRWLRVRLDVGERTYRGAEAEGAVLIAGDRMKYTVARIHLTYEFTFELDASKRPKRLDRKGVAGIVKGSNYPGLYRLVGDTLTIRYTEGSFERDRPAALGRSVPGTVLEVFERQQP